MKPIYVPPLTEERLTQPEELYHKTNKPRYRTRVQMVLLSAEKGLKAEEIVEIVRENPLTVLRWLKRYLAKGVARLKDAPRPGRSATVTEAYRQHLLETVRKRPGSLWGWITHYGLFSVWFMEPTLLFAPAKSFTFDPGPDR